MKRTKKVGGFFLLLGLTILAAASYLYFDMNDFIDSAKKADGRVIDLVRKERNVIRKIRKEYTFSAVVRFTDDKAMSHEFVDRVSSNPPRYSKGQKVRILYVLENPADAIIDDFWGRWAWVGTLGALGGVFSLLGGGMLFRGIKMARTI